MTIIMQLYRYNILYNYTIIYLNFWSLYDINRNIYNNLYVYMIYDIYMYIFLFYIKIYSKNIFKILYIIYIEFIYKIYIIFLLITICIEKDNFRI